MKIAIPVQNNLLCQHFGHCQQFYIADVAIDSKEIKSNELVTPPPHEPGSIPNWLNDLNVDLLITGGMGQMAQNIFIQGGGKVITGASASDPETLINQYLNGELEHGANACDH